jgi:hypothetical protein
MSGNADDDFDLPPVENDVVSTGAAADSADDAKFKGLPQGGNAAAPAPPKLGSLRSR